MSLCLEVLRVLSGVSSFNFFFFRLLYTVGWPHVPDGAHWSWVWSHDQDFVVSSLANHHVVPSSRGASEVVLLTPNSLGQP